MALILNKKPGDFTPHPVTEAPILGVIVDVTPPKEREREYKGVKSTVSEVRLVWETEAKDAEGKRFCIWSRGYPVSGSDPLNEKSNLRKDLKKIMGRDLSAEELKAFDLESIIGTTNKLMIEHEANEGKTYARIVLCQKSDKALDPSGGYKRVKDRDQKDATYNAASAASDAGGSSGETGAASGWENTKVHIEGYNSLPLSDLDIDTIEKLVKVELPVLEAKEKKTIADKRLIAALQEAAKEVF
jgi:hypothetical protein